MVGQRRKIPIGSQWKLRQGLDGATLPVDLGAWQGRNEADLVNVGYILKDNLLL
jgi:hypothetical protein